MTERQTNYTIAEGYTLPSNGLIYPTQFNPSVELRSMTARDEMKRLSPSATPYKTMSEIIEGCLLEKLPVKVYDLAVPDYEFLLHKLRIVTYGDEFKMTLVCPHCGLPTETVAFLEELDVNELDLDLFESLREVKLPASDHVVRLKYLTPRLIDEQTARVKELRRKFKDAALDFTVLVQTASLIDSIDGVKTTLTTAETFIEKLPAKDLLKLIEGINLFNSSFGLDNALTVTCTNCGEDVDTFFRFGSEFFRPTNL